MSKYVIQGGFPLRGEVTIQGAKNAAQKILPATIVFPGTYVLHNLPRIQDTAALIDDDVPLGTSSDAHSVAVAELEFTDQQGRKQRLRKRLVYD